MAGSCILASSAAAATITVTRVDDPALADATGCSLRQAVQAANTNAATGACPPGGTALDTIELPVSVTLTTAGADDTNVGGDLDVLAGGPVRIVGTGTALSGIRQTVADRVLQMVGVTLTLERVNLTGGATAGLTPNGDGGGILLLAGSNLTLTRAIVSGNSAVVSGGIANGHRAVGGSGGTVLIRDSTMSGNTASASSGGGMGAGAIGNINGTLSIVNSTVSGNASAGGRGGGIYSEALSGSVSNVNIASSTITGNSGGGGGNLHNSGNGGAATMRLRSSIVSAPGLTSNCGGSGNGVITSAGFNLSDGTGCGLTSTTDRTQTDPLLGPLVPSGAGTFVHVPQTRSPAIDRGTSDTALPGIGLLSADQRGLPRPVDFTEVVNAVTGGGADVGAVEVQRPPVGPGTPPAPPTCDGRPATIIGTPGPDVLTGTLGPDTIASLAGNDRVVGRAGNDRICLGTGNDRGIGGTGNDRIFAEAGNDILLGQAGNDRLAGASGRDTARGGSGNDQILGGAQNDRLFGDSGNDTIQGNTGNDDLFGNQGRDLLFGNQGRDLLFGDAGRDRLVGGSGFDRASGGADADSCGAEVRISC